MKAWGVEWGRQRKGRENETDEGEGRTDQEARLDWVGVKTTQPGPAVTSFSWQVLHNSSNHQKKPSPAPHLSLSHEKQEDGNRKIEHICKTFNVWYQEKRTLRLSGFWWICWGKKKAQEPFSHLLHVSVWEWLSLNGFPPVPHICTRTAKCRLQFVQADKAEKSGTAQSPSERNKTPLWFSF